MNIDNFPFIHNFIDSHFGIFSSLGVKTCEYMGSASDLMVEWVYSMFLNAKAAASK